MTSCFTLVHSQVVIVTWLLYYEVRVIDQYHWSNSPRETFITCGCCFFECSVFILTFFDRSKVEIIWSFLDFWSFFELEIPEVFKALIRDPRHCRYLFQTFDSRDQKNLFIRAIRVIWDLRGFRVILVLWSLKPIARFASPASRITFVAFSIPSVFECSCRSLQHVSSGF